MPTIAERAQILQNQIFKTQILKTEVLKTEVLKAEVLKARVLPSALGRLLSVVATLCLRSVGPLSIDLWLVFYLGLIMVGAAWLRARASRVLIPFTPWSNLPTTPQCGANHA